MWCFKLNKVVRLLSGTGFYGLPMRSLLMSKKSQRRAEQHNRKNTH